MKINPKVVTLIICATMVGGTFSALALTDGNIIPISFSETSSTFEISSSVSSCYSLSSLNSNESSTVLSTYADSDSKLISSQTSTKTETSSQINSFDNSSENTSTNISSSDSNSNISSITSNITYSNIISSEFIPSMIPDEPYYAILNPDTNYVISVNDPEYMEIRNKLGGDVGKVNYLKSVTLAPYIAKIKSEGYIVGLGYN